MSLRKEQRRGGVESRHAQWIADTGGSSVAGRPLEGNSAKRQTGSRRPLYHGNPWVKSKCFAGVHVPGPRHHQRGGQKCRVDRTRELRLSRCRPTNQRPHSHLPDSRSVHSLCSGWGRFFGRGPHQSAGAGISPDSGT